MENIKDLNVKINDALSFVKTKIEGFVTEDEAMWMSISMFLLGVIVGMFISPRRKVTIGSNNITNNYDQPELDDGEECDEDF